MRLISSLFNAIFRLEQRAQKPALLDSPGHPPIRAYFGVISRPLPRMTGLLMGLFLRRRGLEPYRKS